MKQTLGLYYGTFSIAENQTEKINDTFLTTPGWTKVR